MSRIRYPGIFTALSIALFSPHAFSDDARMFAAFSVVQPDRLSDRGYDRSPSPLAGEWSPPSDIMASLDRWIEPKGTQYWFPLHWAAVQDDIATIDRLVKRGYPVDRRDSFGRTALMAAAVFGNRDAAETLLKFGSDPFLQDEPNGDTALHFAAQSGKTVIVELLLDNRVPIEYRAVRSGVTALHYAAQYGHRRLMEVLLSRGANPNAADYGGVTPIFYASRRGRRSLVALLERAGGRIGGLAEAINANDVARIYRLVADGADIDEAGFLGLPLHLAVSKGYLGIAGILVDSGADIDARLEPFGFTALHIAALHERPQIARFLASRGAVIDILDDQGRSPLAVAAVYGSRETARVLLSNGAQADLPDTVYAMAPIHWAAVHGHLDIIDLLVSGGTDINLRDAVLGKTPLHFAVQKSRAEVVDHLAALGADIDAVDTAGTPAAGYRRPYSKAVRERLDEHATGQ